MSVYLKKRKDGTTMWYYEFMHKGERYRGRGGTTKTQALRAQEKVRTEVLNGEYELKRNTRNPTLESFSRKFLERRKDHRSYERDEVLVMHLLRRFGKRKMSSIHAEDGEDYKGWRRSEGVSNATINRELACLKRMYNLAVDWGDAVNNPLERVKRLPEPEQKDRYVTREEAKKLLDAASPHFRVILETAFNTGMRLQEILGLRWEQVTLYDPPKVRLADGRSVSVYGAIQLEGGQTKSKRNRTIPINRNLHKVLLALEKRDDYVFIGTKGKRLNSVRKPLATALRRSGIPKATFHDFRGSWASWSSEAGMDAFTIQKIGGWRDLKTVLRYVHRNKMDLHVAMQRLDGVLDSRNIPENANILEMKQQFGGM